MHASRLVAGTCRLSRPCQSAGSVGRGQHPVHWSRARGRAHDMCVAAKLPSPLARVYAPSLSHIARGLEPMEYRMLRKPLWYEFLNMAATATARAARREALCCEPFRPHQCSAQAQPAGAPSVRRARCAHAWGRKRPAVWVGCGYRIDLVSLVPVFPAAAS